MLPIPLVLQPLKNGLMVFPTHWLQSGSLDFSQALIFTEISGYSSGALSRFLEQASNPQTMAEVIPPSWLNIPRPEQPPAQVEMPLDTPLPAV